MPPKDTKAQGAKVTQLKRPKASRSRETSADNATAGPSKPSVTLMPRLPSPLKSADDVFKTPDKPIPIVDFRDPSPKRPQTEASSENFDKSNVNSRKPLRHNRSSSLIGVNENTNGEGKSLSSGPSPRVKPPSFVSKVSHTANRSETPFSETNNDNLSISDSIADFSSPSSARIKRTENERKQYFENQPECGDVEAHRVFCTRCKEWVRLSTKQTYYVKPWEVHRTKCDQKSPIEKTYKNLGLVATIPFTVPRTEKNRKALLELDDTAETVEPNQVKCKTCNNWIPLEKKYSIRCWTKHVAGCQQDLKPGDVEKKLERKLFFLCDKQFKGFRDEHTVECATCGNDVSLNSEVEYDLKRWLEHKETCDPSTSSASQPRTTPNPKSKLPQESQERKRIIPAPDNNTPEPDASVQAETIPLPESPKSKSEPASPERNRLVMSESERTLVESASYATIPVEVQQPAPAPPPSLKRKRDEDTSMDVDEQDEEEERPSIRPRTEDYVPDDRDSPSGLGWFLLPFKAFVRGFRESLTTLDD